MDPVSAAAPAGAAGMRGGAAWSALNAGAGVLLPFMLFIFFARSLPPALVGLAVLATSVAEIVKAFGLPGLYEALLQQQHDRLRCHQTVSAVMVICGAVLFGVYLLVIAALPVLVPALHGNFWALAPVGLRIPLDLLTVQPQAALAQRLAYGRMALRSVVANIGAGAIGIVLAMAGHPFTGLIAYLVAQSALIFITTAAGRGVLAAPVLRRSCLQAMRREGLAASVVRLVAAVNNTLDQIVVAGVIGSATLGFFNLGKRVETTFITAASAFATILFQPLFAVQHPAHRQAGLRRGLRLLTLLCGAPCAFMLINAGPLVGLVFGRSWQAAAPVAAIMAGSGLVRALGSVHGALLSVSARNRRLMRVTLASASGGILAVLCLAPHGIVAVAVGLAIKNMAMTAWMARLTRTDLPRPLRAYAGVVAAPMLVMLAAALAGRMLAAALPLAGTHATLAGLALSGLCLAMAAAGLALQAIGAAPVQSAFRRFRNRNINLRRPVAP